MKEKSITDIVKEMYDEKGKAFGIMKQPVQRFDQWESELAQWENRFNKRMADIEKWVEKPMRKMENFFE